jgi:hypothetical protein
VRDKVNLWRLYNQSTGYGRRPSDYFEHLETDLAKWVLDEKCLSIGRMYENALNEGKDPFAGAAEGDRSQVKGKYASAPKRRIHKIKSLAEIGIQDGNSTR